MGAVSGLLPVGWEVTVASAAVAFAVPLLLAAVGECIAERAGVLNLGVEGLMLCAALAAVAVSHAAGSGWAGLGAAVPAALLPGALFGYLTAYRRANQIVAGTALNLLALGVTGTVYAALTRQAAAAGASRLLGVRLPDWPVPGLASLPVVGPTLFSGNALAYAAFLSVPVAAVVLFRTRVGLELRAAGEHPRAAEAAGVDVARTRFLAVLVGAAMAGLAGAFLTVGHVVSFAEGMTAGKGFIALALVIFGRWNPWGVLAGTVLFSLAWGFGTALSAQGRGRPEEVFLLALPYVATLIALLFRTGRTAAPAALGQADAAR